MCKNAAACAPSGMARKCTWRWGGGVLHWRTGTVRPRSPVPVSAVRATPFSVNSLKLSPLAPPLRPQPSPTPTPPPTSGSNGILQSAAIPATRRSLASAFPPKNNRADVIFKVGFKGRKRSTAVVTRGCVITHGFPTLSTALTIKRWEMETSDEHEWKWNLNAFHQNWKCRQMRPQFLG